MLAEVVRLVVAHWRAVGGGTGTSLPRDATAQIMFTPFIEELFGVRNPAARDILAYWLALVLAIAAIGGIYWLLRTRRGLALAAVRDNLEAAQSVGVNAAVTQWIVFLAAALGTGLTGALIYMQKARIPRCGLLSQRLDRLCHLHRGDRRHRHHRRPHRRRPCLFPLQSLLAQYGTRYLIVLGLIGVLVMLFAPRGLWGLLSDRTGLQLFPIRRQLVGAPNPKPSTSRRPDHG